MSTRKVAFWQISFYTVVMGKQKAHPLVAAVVAAIAAEMDRQQVNRRGLATAAGLSATAVTRLFAGEREDPSLSTLLRLADALGMDLRAAFPAPKRARR